MRSNAFKFVSVAILLFSIAATSAGHSAETVRENTPHIDILFSGEENGYLEPCGCAEGQMGGMKRRHEFIKTLNNNPNLILPVSLGDLPKEVNRQNEIKAEVMLRAMGMMNYAAHNIGEKDAAMGALTLAYLAEISNVPFISSNVVFPSESGLKIAPYLIKKIKTKKPKIKLKVGILGVLSPELLENDPYGEVVVHDPVESLKPLVKKLRKKTDILILLAHTEYEYAVKIASHFPELDIVIAGHDMDDTEHTVKEINRETLIASAGRHGKHVGVATFEMRNKKWRPLPDADKTRATIVALGREFNKPSEMDSVIDEYKDMVMYEDILNQHQKLPIDSDEEYAGNMACGACHLKIFSHWKDTKHHHAHETLEKVKSHFDPECIQCHTTGFEYASGFKNMEETPSLKGVGCESCHGVGAAHMADVNAPYGKAGNEECIKCHDPENSPKFEYQTYWEKIKHP